MEQIILRIGLEGLYIAFLISLPVVLTALAIGLFISIIQAATQIQDQTITFVPKLIGIAVIIYLFGGWMLSHIVNFMNRSFQILSLTGG
jgi:flagellar biosynthetic protein FliQ